MKRTSKKKWMSLLIVITLMMSLMLVGCNQSSSDPADPQASTSFQIRGSDTEVNMVQRLTEVYAEIKTNVSFAVTGGGSGTGIAALINNQIDIANSSRPMSDSEIQQAQNNGVEPVAFIFAQDGLAIIVHPDNQINSLTLEQLGKIYSGEITNWNQVGGADMMISAYGRQSTSGTFSYFRDAVVKADYTEDKKMMSGNAAIVEGVIADVAGIGYVGIGYAAEDGQARSGLKILLLSEDETKTPATPLDMASITDGSYPLVRPLYHYTNGKPTGALKDYLEFVLSEQGQSIVTEQGFFPITSEHQQFNQNNF